MRFKVEVSAFRVLVGVLGFMVCWSRGFGFVAYFFFVFFVSLGGRGR